MKILGYQNLTSIHREIYTTGFYVANDVRSDHLESIINGLGVPRMDPRSSEAIRNVRPQKLAEARPNTLSSRFGMGAFPHHTDVAHWIVPARFLLLYCTNPGSGERPTLLIDSAEWALAEWEKKAIFREVWKTGHFRPHLCTIGWRTNNRIAIRFDEACMVPMTLGAEKLRSNLVRHIRGTPNTRIRWSPGKLLVIDNHRMLHARGETQDDDRDRVLQRVLIGG